MPARHHDQPNGTPNWIVLDAPDAIAAREFYRGLFGWEIEATPSDGDNALLATKNGLEVAGLRAADRLMQGAPSWITYLATDNIAVTVIKIIGAGGKILASPTSAKPAARGRSALAQDVGGAVFGLWQAVESRRMGAWEEDGTIMWSENFTASPQENKAFYHDVFGNIRFAEPFPWHFGDPSHARPGYTMFSANGEQVGPYGENAVASIGELDPRGRTETPHWIPVFATLDIDKALKRLVTLGGTIVLASYPTMFGPLAKVEDNQGATFMLAGKPKR